MDKLILFTASFPFGNKETYLESEIVFLAKVFDKVEIYPHYYNQGNKKQREVPNNVQVHTPAYPLSKIGRLYQALKGLFKGAKGLLFFKEFFKFKVYKSSRNFLRWLFALFDYLATLGSPQYNRIKKEKQAVFYFYWGIGWSYVCLNLNKEVARKCFIRLHGGDTYLERANGYLPLRKEIFEKSDYLLPISNDLAAYLENRYNVLPEKIIISRLGVCMLNRVSYFQAIDSTEMHIVSCSNMIKLKRIDMIVEALKFLDGTLVKWIHFGDGIEMKAIKDQIEASDFKTIKVELIGRKHNSEVLDYYKNYEIDAFVNISKHEGVPVSIMEAMSFKIPCIATNVGATSEIVNNKNGILLDEDFSINDLVISLQSIKSDQWKKKRDLAFSHCNQFFDAEKNYKQLARILKK